VRFDVTKIREVYGGGHLHALTDHAARSWAATSPDLPHDALFAGAVGAAA
tara:strand:- start:291 stop:440 length:150 start_codon:yes stop_codon:yes gene_type:complete